MRYLILIYENEATAPQDESEMQRWFAYTDELRKAGVMLGGEALHPTSAATTVRLKNGKRVVTDGPFAETKEQLGGFYLIDVPNLDEALKWAEKIPSADRGPVEVRPVLDFGE
ncbi:MAG TPA: YciI family protein [Longimicrobiales bacterium]